MGSMYEISNFDHMNAKVNALTHKVDNLSITTTTAAISITPKCKIYGVSNHIRAEWKLLA